jgi:hypothetical protein
MDVENLAKELILKNMTPEQQMAVLDSVRSSVAQAKEVQKRKIGENVDLVVQALKKIESDIRSRFDDVGNAIEKRVSTIKDGRDGINGKDGRDGKDGRNGRDGAKGDKGERGQDGVDGSNGVDGVSVTSARIDFDGSLIISLSSGIELNVGEVVAPDLAESIKVITNGGGTSQYVLDTLASLQTQITNLIPSQTGNSGKFLTTNGTSTSWASVAGGLSYQGTWNASTNTPTLTSSVGTNGYYYIVATAGSTNLNGITSWNIGDWLMFNGSVWQKIDQSETLQSITSTDGSVTVTTTGSTADLSVAVAASTTNVICLVRNTTGATLTKGTAVYISGATGQNPTISKADPNTDATSAQTLGLMSADLANNSNGYVTIIGLITNIDTSAYTDGQQLYLSGSAAGTLTGTKPYAPVHIVYAAVVEHAHPTQGKLFVKVQNGYELDELHNVSAQSPSNGQTIVYNATTSLWEKANLTAGTGISVSNGAGSITVSNSGVTSVTGTSPVASSGGATPAISLASGYGDTQNPYASKTANYVLAAPNGSAGVPTFRALVSADIPTLNQNTTGTASNVTGTVAIANGGTGQTTATAAFDALAPSQTSNSGKYLTTNGSTTSWATVSSTGTVTSVAATVPAFLSITGSPITTSGTLAIGLSGTALPVANGGTGITSLGTGVATWLGTPSSANLASAVTGETGSGALVFGTSPTLTTPTIDSAQVATVSGTAPLYMARAWVNFNGTTNTAGFCTIRASGNVTSVADNGTGDYTVNFTTAMPDADYVTTGTCSGSDSPSNNVATLNTKLTSGLTTSSCRLYSTNASGTAADRAFMAVAIFR